MRPWLVVVAVALLAACGPSPGERVPIDKSPTMQAERRQFLDKLVRQGLIQRVEERGTMPRLWVTPAFRMLDFQTKEKFVSVAFALYCTGESYGDVVTLVDSISGTEIGSYSLGNPGLKLQ